MWQWVIQIALLMWKMIKRLVTFHYANQTLTQKHQAEGDGPTPPSPLKKKEKETL